PGTRGSAGSWTRGQTSQGCRQSLANETSGAAHGPRPAKAATVLGNSRGARCVSHLDAAPTIPDLVKRKLALSLVALAVFICLALVAEAKIPYVSTWATALAAAEAVLGLGWLFLRAVRRFLWRVGRRLAFSYFLIGVLPIP